MSELAGLSGSQTPWPTGTDLVLRTHVFTLCSSGPTRHKLAIKASLPGNGSVRPSLQGVHHHSIAICYGVTAHCSVTNKKMEQENECKLTDLSKQKRHQRTKLSPLTQPFAFRPTPDPLTNIACHPHARPPHNISQLVMCNAPHLVF